MRKWLLSIGAAIILIIIAIIAFPNVIDVKKEPNPVEDFALRKDSLKKIATIELQKEFIYHGDLILVNKEHPVQEVGIISDIISLKKNSELIEGYTLSSDDIMLSEDIAHQFSKMMEAARKEGLVHFTINSGFRSFEEQQELYEKMGPSYSLPPGFSEHNVGLSLDVGSTQMKMEVAPEGKWIEENAWKYGFVLRYPKDKTEITGILYEPWHIRYVGLPHSAIMKENNWVLEEYLSYLTKDTKISTTVNGTEYVVSYYPIENEITIPKPTYVYEISGNNMDGVIVTEWRE